MGAYTGLIDIFCGVEENPFSSFDGLFKKEPLPFSSIAEWFWWVGDEAAVDDAWK